MYGRRGGDGALIPDPAANAADGARRRVSPRRRVLNDSADSTRSRYLLPERDGVRLCGVGSRGGSVRGFHSSDLARNCWSWETHLIAWAGSADDVNCSASVSWPSFVGRQALSAPRGTVRAFGRTESESDSRPWGMDGSSASSPRGAGLVPSPHNSAHLRVPFEAPDAGTTLSCGVIAA